MKAFVVNGSPHTEKGNTALILDPFVEGMKDEGASVDVVYTKRLDVAPCEGDYACWFKTPGACFRHDDMERMLPLASSADILVFATPVYVDGATGPLKNFMDRLIPIGHPEIEVREGHCRHPQRERLENGVLALVANCGFWELDNFDPLVVHMKAAAKNLGREYAGALLRPHGGALRPMIDGAMGVQDVLDAAREAGREIVRHGRISERAMNIVSRELLPRETFVDIANTRMKQALDKLERR